MHRLAHHSPFASEREAIGLTVAGARALTLISSLATGGAERVTVTLLCGLAEAGQQASVCTLTARDDGPLAAELSAAGVVRHDLRARRLADPLALLRLLALLRRERVEVIHAHGQDASILGAAVRAISGIPLVITRHVLEEPGGNRRQRLRSRLALAAFRRADAAVAVSAAAADNLATLAHMPREAISVIRNGIDVARFDRAELRSRRSELRSALGCEANDFLILVPAVLRDGKGHDVLLEALPTIKERAPGARVLLAGGGEREEALRALARRHQEAVVFLGFRDDMAELYAACDLVALPSMAEALPTALMEAAAAGRPVVATRVGGTPEVVEDGRTGMIVPPGDPGALARAVLALWSDQEKMHAFGERARTVAWQRFELQQQLQLTLSLWDEVATRGSR